MVSYHSYLCKRKSVLTQLKLVQKLKLCTLQLQVVVLVHIYSPVTTEALLRMVAPGAEFCGVTLCDVTTFMKIMSKSR